MWLHYGRGGLLGGLPLEGIGELKGTELEGYCLGLRCHRSSSIPTTVLRLVLVFQDSLGLVVAYGEVFYLEGWPRACP